MDCIKVSRLLSQYIDGMLDENENNEVRAHIESCSSCMNEYKELKLIAERCREINEIDLPENFSSELHLKLEEIDKDIHKKASFIWTKKYMAAALILIFLSAAILLRLGIFNIYPEKNSNMLAGSASKSEAYDSAPTENQSRIQASVKESADSKNDVSDQYGDTDLYYYVITVELDENDYKQKYADISSFLTDAGGIKEDEVQDSVSLAFPKDKFQEILNKLRDEYKLNNVDSQRIDMTEQYAELLREIDSLKEETVDKDKELSNSGQTINDEIAEKEKKVQEIKKSCEYVYVKILGKIH